MLRPPLAIPTPMMAPITACELETGTNGSEGRLWLIKKVCSELEANKNKTTDCEKTTIQAIAGVMYIRLLPMV